jgi:hypothetical protein
MGIDEFLAYSILRFCIFAKSKFLSFYWGVLRKRYLKRIVKHSLEQCKNQTLEERGYLIGELKTE